jgi:hypothetical protein
LLSPNRTELVFDSSQKISSEQVRFAAATRAEHDAASILKPGRRDFNAALRGDASLDIAPEIGAPEIPRSAARLHAIEEDPSTVRRDADVLVSAWLADRPDFTTGPIEPEELRRVRVRMVGQHSVSGRREHRSGDREVIVDRLGDGERIADEALGRQIEPLSDENTVLDEQQEIRIDPLDVRNG